MSPGLLVLHWVLLPLLFLAWSMGLWALFLILHVFAWGGDE